MGTNAFYLRSLFRVYLLYISMPCETWLYGQEKRKRTHFLFNVSSMLSDTSCVLLCVPDLVKGNVVRTLQILLRS